MSISIDESVSSLIACHSQITKLYSETLLNHSTPVDVVDLLLQLVKERGRLLDSVLLNLSRLDEIDQRKLGGQLNNILIDGEKIIAQASEAQSNIRKELAEHQSKNKKINMYKLNESK